MGFAPLEIFQTMKGWLTYPADVRADLYDCLDACQRLLTSLQELADESKRLSAETCSAINSLLEARSQPKGPQVAELQMVAEAAKEARRKGDALTPELAQSLAALKASEHTK